MDRSKRDVALKISKRRLFICLAWFAMFLAALQIVAAFIVCQAEICHRPAGRFVTVSGVRLHYLERGDGPTVVLIHGNDGIAQDFSVCLTGKLCGRYKTLAFDRPGHGYSQRPANQLATADAQARLIHDALLKLGVRKALIVGHSWGGSVALAYALMYAHDLAGVVLLSAVAYPTEESMGHAQDYMEMIPLVGDLLMSSFVVSARPSLEFNVATASYPVSLPKQYVDTYASLSLRPTQIRSYAEDEITLNSTLAKLSAHYGEIEIPVIIVTGTCDDIVPPEKHSYRLHRQIRQSALMTIEGAGHEIELSNCDEIKEAINIAWRQAQMMGE